MFEIEQAIHIMTTVSASIPPTKPSKDVLLLQKDIFTIYLEPLLKIHNLSTTPTTCNNNATTNAMITYEDLTSSFQLAVASLGKTNTNVDVTGKNFVVRTSSVSIQFRCIVIRYKK